MIYMTERMHPVSVAAYYLLVLGFTMFTQNPLLLLVSFFTAYFFHISLTGGKGAGKTLLFYLILVALVTVTNPLFFRYGEKVLLTIGKWRFTEESMEYGFKNGLMIAAVMVWCQSFGRLMTTDRFMYLMGRRFPKIALVLSMTIRFIPALQKQYRNAHGLRKMMLAGERTGWFSRVRGAAEEMDSLLSWSLENAIETSMSMSAREYGKKRRTNYSDYKMAAMDWASLAFMALAGLAVMINSAAEAVLFFFPFLLIIREKIEWNCLKSKI